MNKEERRKREEGLIYWCKDMMEKYLVYWSADDKIYKNLKQFYDEGIIKGLIHKSTTQRRKIEVFSQIANEINQKYNELTIK